MAHLPLPAETITRGPGRRHPSGRRRLRLLGSVEGEDPGAVEEGRRWHLAIVGELLARLHGNARGTRLPFGDIPSERGVNVAALAGETARQHVTVLDRHVAALRERRHGGVRGVAEQGHPPLRPLWHRIAIVDSPFVDVVNVAEHAEQRLVPALVGVQQFLLRTLCRPGLLDPLVGHVTGEDIQRVALPDWIANDGTVWSDPA